MSKRRKSRRSPTPPAVTPAPETGLTVISEPRAPRIASPHHNGNHNGLLVSVTGAKPRETGTPTDFGKVEFFDKANGGSYLHLYIATASMVAVSFGPEQDFRCWNYAAFSVPDEHAAVSLLSGKGPEQVSGCTKRNSIHARLSARADMGRIADLGAAAAFVATQIDIGEPNLPAVSYVGSSRAQNGEHQIRARLFAPVAGSPIAVATTHLREDTTSMLAFEGSNTDAIATSLNQGTMVPGGSCHALPEFIDISMFRAEQSAEAYIGQLLARSMCQYAE